MTKTAVITGASSGLGAAFARQLAQRGLNLVLAARRKERLESVRAAILAEFPIQIDLVQADLSTEAGISAVEDAIRNLDELSILINNAGYGILGKFSSDPVEKQLDMIQVHVMAAVRLTRAALPGMLEKRQGAIINVASMAAYIPIGNGTYSGTKAFLLNFSKALASELWDSGIKVQALVSGFVQTEFHSTPEFQGFQRAIIPKLFWLEAPAVVAESLRCLDRDQLECVPGWPYKVAHHLVRSPLTAGLVMAFVKYLYTRKKTKPTLVSR